MTARAVALAQRAAGPLLVALIFVNPFSKAGSEICTSLLLAAWFIGYCRPLQLRAALESTRPAKWVWLTLFLYLGLCMLSILYSTHPESSLRGFIRKTLEYALQFLIAADLVRRRTELGDRSARALFAAAWLILLYGLFQEWLIARALYPPLVVDPFTGKNFNYTRMIGPYENPNDLATFLMVVGLLAIGLLTGTLSRGARIHLTLLSTALVGGLLWTASLGGLLGFIGGMGVLLLLNFRRGRAGLWLAGGTLLAGALFLLLARDHLREILTLGDIASRERLVMWKTALAMIRAAPFLGHGLNTFMANYNFYAGDAALWPAYAHNCYLQITAETGLLGLALFGLFLGSGAALGWKALRERPSPLLTGLLAGLFAFLIQSLFDTNLYALRQAVLFWTLSGVAIGLALGCLSSEKSS